MFGVKNSEAILRIYSPYIRETAVSFETEVPAADEFSSRIETIGKQYPYLVYQVDDEIVGYAYASRHRERAAYRYDVDVAIYVLPRHHGSGIAYTLYDLLFKILEQLGYVNAYAGITASNRKSVNFHRKFGFTLVGTYHHTGFKLGRWHDVAWFEKTVNAYEAAPKPVKPVSGLSDEFLKGIFCNL